MYEKMCGLLKCTGGMYSWLVLTPQVASKNYFGRK